MTPITTSTPTSRPEALSKATGSAASSASATNRTGIFGAEENQFDMFLKLLTTQMQNQDPLDPMDTSQYTQQLVSYSQVEQSIKQTGLLRDLLSRMSSNDLAQASGMIGREVEFDSRVAGLGDRPASWNWSLPRPASSISGTVVDSSGKTVANVTLPASVASGRYVWDGVLADGSRAAPGAYVLKLTAVDSAGNSMPATLRSVGRVEEVMSRDGELWLGIGGAALPLSELVRVLAVPPVVPAAGAAPVA